MQLSERIEQRRFVGREFLLFLWFESESSTLRCPPKSIAVWSAI